MLRFLEIRRVSHHLFIEDRIEEKAARVAERKFKISPREVAGGLSSFQQHAAMYGNRWHLINNTGAALSTTRTRNLGDRRPCSDFGPRQSRRFGHQITSRCGIGTMKRPP